MKVKPKNNEKTKQKKDQVKFKKVTPALEDKIKNIWLDPTNGYKGCYINMISLIHVVSKLEKLFRWPFQNQIFIGFLSEVFYFITNALGKQVNITFDNI